MLTKEQFIVEVWERTGQDVAGAVELALIQEAFTKQFGSGAMVSPAAIARVLADHGARLKHPEILQADVRWRESNLFFTPEDLTLGTLEGATALMEKIETLRRQLEGQKPKLEELYRQVRQFKTELQSIPTSLGHELAQWLTVWLQNPEIFAEWLDLRRATPEFRQRFKS